MLKDQPGEGGRRRGGRCSRCQARECPRVRPEDVGRQLVRGVKMTWFSR